MGTSPITIPTLKFTRKVWNVSSSPSMVSIISLLNKTSHTRSNTSENAQKIRKIQHLQDYSSAVKTMTVDTGWVSPQEGAYSALTTTQKAKKKNKRKIRKSTKSLRQNQPSNFQNPMTPQTQGGVAKENTFMFSLPQNKSLMCGGGTLGSMGTIMSSFGMNSATSTWMKQNDKRSTSPKHQSKPSVGKNKLKVDCLKHLKLESKYLNHHP